jgi:hypothetical protein
MDGEYNVSTDTKEKIKLDSRIVYADWLSSIARGGAEAELRVKTVFVAESSSIEIKGRSSEGKAPDSIKGKVFNDEFIGKLLIPEKVTLGADIWFEAKLPKHGLSMESGTSIPAKPAILASKICWDRSEVKRGEEVLLTCQFESGVQDGEDATVIIYEHNPNSYDFKVTSFQTTIQNNKVEATWAFDYYDDTDEIPTHKELQPVGKNYALPQYYFVVVVDGIEIGEKRESGLLKFKDWIEFSLTDDDGNPCSDLKGSLALADGSKIDFTLDKDGKCSKEDIVPGKFIFSFEDITKVNSVDAETGEVKPAQQSPDGGLAVIKTGESFRFQLCPYKISA